MNRYSTIPCLTPRQPTLDSRPPAIRKLDKLRGLNDGWSFGNGLRFSEPTIDMAKTLVLRAREFGFLESDVFPGLQSDVIVTVYDGLHSLEFTIGSDGRVDFVHEVGKVEKDSEDALTLGESIGRIQELRRNLCESFDFSNHCISTDGSDGLEALHSRHREETAGYPSWTKIVYGQWAIQSANTSPSITRALQAI